MEVFLAKRREARKAFLEAGNDFVVETFLKMRNPAPIPFMASPMEPGFMFKRQAE